jgi:hypothetical protein
VALHPRTVEARRGLVWLRQGFQVFFRKPLASTLLFVVFLFTALVAMALPHLGRILVMMALRAGLAALLSIPFWHIPALVYWGGQGAMQALFSSTVACWRKRGALLPCAIGWTGVIAAFSVVVGLLFGLLGARQRVGVVALPAGLMFTCVFCASLYFTFADTFGESGATRE